MSEVISAHHIFFAYSRKAVLEDISFTVQAGDYIGLIGPNGGGKTTLLKVLLGLEPAGQGEVKLFGTPLSTFKAWHQIGYLAQKSPVAQSRFPISAEEVVLMGLPGRGARVEHGELKEVYEAMQQTHTRDFAGRVFHDLSIGQQQRILLARALVSKPQLLILDEPSTALDASSREMFFDLLGQLNKTRGTTILLITHDTGEVGKYISKFMYVDKNLIFYGTKKDFCHSKEVAQKLGPFAQHTIDHLHDGHGHCPLGAACQECHHD